jgi:hypothetical protein
MTPTTSDCTPKPAYFETAVSESKQFRKDLDAVLQRIKGPTRRSRERSIVITKLQEAIMWLGMDLKALDEERPGVAPNPYPQSYDPASLIVEKTADGLKL